MTVISVARAAYPVQTVASALAALAEMIAIRRQRAALGRLDDCRLADLGITRAEAAREARRRAWDVPAHWHR